MSTKMSTANTALNCLFCFSNISNSHFQPENQKNLTPLDVISCCNKHLSKDFIDSLIWTNPSSAVGSLCQECYDIAGNLNCLNINLNKIIDDINKLGSLLSIRISTERRNYELSNQKRSEVIRNSDSNQHQHYPDWSYEVHTIHVNDQNQKDFMTATSSFDSVTPVTDSFDNRNGSFFNDINAATHQRESCQLSQGNPINDKQGPRKTSVKKINTLDQKTAGKAVSKGDEIITGTELQRHLQNGSDAGFKCDKCNKIFSRLTILQRHDCSKPTYECEVCQKSFSGTGVLKLHMRSHTGERPYKCETCEKCFAVKCHLTAHIRTHTGDKPFKCTFCDKSFRDQGYLTKHLTTHESTTVKKYKCDICSKFLGTLQYLKIHLQYHSNDREEICSICGKGFKTKIKLKLHEKMHSLKEERAHKCHICGKGFPTKYTLKSHITHHSGMKPFLCEECGKSFYTANLLEHHSKLHTEKGPFKCAICNTVYEGSYRLKLHNARYHSANALKCEKCDRVFRSKEALQKHLEKMCCNQTILKAEKLYKCGSCEKTFSTNNGRQLHQIKHLPINERPSFVCEVCDTTFDQVVNMKKHHKKHHPGLPYFIKKESVSCRICKRYFKIFMEFTKHKENKTGESIRCMHCPEVFSSECEDTFHHRRVHPHENSSFDCKNCNKPLDAFFNCLVQTFQTKERRMGKLKGNEQENQNSLSKRNYLTRMCKEKYIEDSENSKGSPSNRNDISDNESESDSGSDSFHEDNSSDIEIKVENDSDTEIKTEYSEYILP